MFIPCVVCPETHNLSLLMEKYKTNQNCVVSYKILFKLSPDLSRWLKNNNCKNCQSQKQKQNTSEDMTTECGILEQKRSIIEKEKKSDIN